MADEPQGPPYKSFADVPKGRPTPTQDELNKAALGEPVELSPDGTPPEPPRPGFKGAAPAHAAAHAPAHAATTRAPKT